MIIVTQPTYGKNLQIEVFGLIRSQNRVLAAIGYGGTKYTNLVKEITRTPYFKNINTNIVVKLNTDNFNMLAEDHKT